jgi:hypothetical protein
VDVVRVVVWRIRVNKKGQLDTLCVFRLIYIFWSFWI